MYIYTWFEERGERVLQLACDGGTAGQLFAAGSEGVAGKKERGLEIWVSSPAPSALRTGDENGAFFVF